MIERDSERGSRFIIFQPKKTTKGKKSLNEHYLSSVSVSDGF